MKAESVAGGILVRQAQGARDADAIERDKPLAVRWRRHLRGFLDRMIAASSLVPDDAVLDVRDFEWTGYLRENWRAIRDEALAAVAPRAAPPLTAIPRDRRIDRTGTRRSYFLWGYGRSIDENLDLCPVTATLVERIPGLDSAFFSILAPGAHIPAHRGVTKGLITCHLGLVIPRDGDARMRIEDRVLRWSEGETLIFDDTRDHEVWNGTSATRIVLAIQFRRPLRNPGRWIAGQILGAVRRSAFVQAVRADPRGWNREPAT